MRISTVKKILLGLTAFSLFVTPARASEITDRDGNPLIDPTANFHNLYAQEIDGSTARSSYDKFTLDENEIANLHFNVEGGSAFAIDLINTVNHRIDINGTVNAIRNGAIDGNLFFLSPEGIAIGKSGVINAGAFIAQSDGGSIEIRGAINARNNITINAQEININGAELTANTNLDFTNLVNAGSTVNNIDNLRMTVDPSGNGDIIIRAEASLTTNVTDKGINPNAFNDAAQIVINSSTLNATGDITVESKVARSIKANANGQDNINVQAIMINAGVSDLDSAYAQKLINENGFEAPEPNGGAITDIGYSTLNAGGAVRISSVEETLVDLMNGTNYAATGGDIVGATVIAVNSNAKTVLTRSTVNGSSVDITAAQGGNGITSDINEVSGGVAEFGIGYNAVKRGGETLVNLRGSDITATTGDINLRAEDDFKINLKNYFAPAVAVGTPSTVGKSTNNAAARVLLESYARNADNLSAAGNININAVNNIATNVNVNNARADGTASTIANVVDNARANVAVINSGHKFSGANINLATEYNPAVTVYIQDIYSKSNNRNQMTSTARLNGGASIEVSNANSFNAPVVNYSAVSGSADRLAAEAYVSSVNAANDFVNTAAVYSNTDTNIKVGSEKYAAGANVTVDSSNNINRHANANGYTIGSSSDRNAANINAADKISANIGADNAIEQSVGSLTVNATGGGASNLKASVTPNDSYYNYSKSTVDNRSNINVNATVGGKWSIDNALAVNAASDIAANVHARQGSAGYNNGGDIFISNIIGGTTNAALDSGSIINAATADISARSNFNVGGYNDDESYTVVNYFGRLTKEDINSMLDVDKKTYVDLNGALETTGAQSFTADDEGNLINAVNANGEISTLSIGKNALEAAAVTNVAVDNKIRVGTDASLKSAGTLNMRATDLLSLESSSIGTNSNSFGDLVNLSKNTLDRKNIVDVRGSVYADSNINVDVGRAAVFYPSNVSITAESVNSVIRNGAQSSYDLTENNAINVNGSIQGAGDVNIRALGAPVELQYSIKNRNHESNYYRPEELSVGEGSKFNGITVNGIVQAGIAPEDINIDITGRVVPSDYNIAGTDNGGSIKVTSNIDVDYTEGDQEHAKELVAKLNALNVLIDQYYTNAQSEVNTAAVAGYVAERERVKQKLRELGLMTSEGNQESAVAEGLEIRYVELGNISSLGGNLNLKTSTINGNGTLKTAGAPNINITNTSNAYLILNDIIRDSTVGNITVNGKTKYSGDAAFASSLKIDNAAERGSGKISVRNNPDTSAVNVTAKTNGSTSTYTPRPDLRLKGSIENFYGDISLVNTKGDIDIAADYITDENGTLVVANEANVVGKNILIESAGTLNQGYVEGILNIGKSLENLYAKETDGKTANARNHINPLLASDEYSTVIANNIEGGTNDGKISGSNIYIAADTINVNGIIQSGYDNYIVDVGSYEFTYGRLNSVVGPVYNSDKGYYDYRVPVSYVDGKLIVDDIETGGGQIYLSGRIVSTGKGRIFAANGFADITIRNDDVDRPLELGRIINNNRAGKITIVDIDNDTWTEYTPGQTRVLNNYAQILKDHYADDMLYDTVQTSSNNLGSETMQYQPAVGMRYNWTDGSEQRTTARVSYQGTLTDPKSNMTLDSNEWNDYMRTVTPNEQRVDFAYIDKGTFLSTDNSTAAADNNLYLTAESQRLNYSYVVHKGGFLNFNRSWDYTLETLQSYAFNVDASKPITLGFIGHKNGSVDITAKNDVILAGNVQVGNKDANLSVTSNNGSITQLDGSAIRTESAEFKAAGDISGINIESLGSVKNGNYTDKVFVRTSTSANVDVNVSGGGLDGRALPGNVLFVPSRQHLGDTQRGDITLTATGNIDISIWSFITTVRNLKATSVNGYVGTHDIPWWLDASGTVDINAHDDININVRGDTTLTIGQMNSEKGSVFITGGTNFKVVQSPDYQPEGANIDINEQIKKWVDAGLIAPTADYEGTYVGGLKKAVNDYAANIGAEYQTYAAGKADYENLKTTVTNEYQEYVSIKDGYAERVNEVDEVFEDYLFDSRSLRNSLEDEYARMLKYRATTFLSDSQQKTLAKLEAKFNGFDSANAYYIVHAAEELGKEEYRPFIGYDDVHSYMASTHEGQLMAKYQNFDSADAYLQTTAGYALEQKYGAYATVEDFLNTDAKYRELVAARDNVTFPNTLEQMRTQEALEREANAYNIKSAHLYIANKKLR